jgi:hypothetical protein
MGFASQHTRNVLASNLLFGTLVLSLTFSILESYLPHPLPRHYTPWTVAMLAAVYLLRALLYYAIRIDKQWAKKILLAIYLVNGALAVLFYSTNPLARQMARHPVEIFSTVIVEATVGIALILLFKKDASQAV